MAEIGKALEEVWKREFLAIPLVIQHTFIIGTTYGPYSHGAYSLMRKTWMYKCTNKYTSINSDNVIKKYCATEKITEVM